MDRRSSMRYYNSAVTLYIYLPLKIYDIHVGRPIFCFSVIMLDKQTNTFPNIIYSLYGVNIHCLYGQ